MREFSKVIQKLWKSTYFRNLRGFLNISDISSEKIDEKITNLRMNYSEYIENGFELIDGMGVERLINVMNN